MESIKILILYSGGLDSFLLYQMAIREHGEENVTCVFFKHGQDSQDAEIAVLPDFVQVRELEWLDKNIKAVSKTEDPFGGAIYIPGRNLVFCVTAASQYLPHEIWMGTVVDEDNEHATDKNEQFRLMTEDLLEYVLSPFTGFIRIRFPFVEKNMTKLNAVNWALENGVSKSNIIKTTSCWHNKNGIPCGECKQCLKRHLVFTLAGMGEDYVVHPLESEKQQEVILKYLQTFVDKDYYSNADEENVVKMLVRYFSSFYIYSLEPKVWELEVDRLCKLIYGGLRNEWEVV